VQQIKTKYEICASHNAMMLCCGNIKLTFIISSSNNSNNNNNLYLNGKSFAGNEKIERQKRKN